MRRMRMRRSMRRRTARVDEGGDELAAVAALDGVEF